MSSDAASEKELHIAPMLDVSTPEFRQLMRILTKRAVLWTEMVVDETVVFSSETDEKLAFDLETRPVVCQIGGISPDWSGTTAALIEAYGYNEINLNCDCPSQRVSGKRQFGAALMKQPTRAIATVQAMTKRTNLNVSVKTRIGVDDLDDWHFLVDFIRGFTPICRRFVIHARKCLLQGLSPAQNRIVPPLNYPRVYALCRDFPDCDFWINGGIPGLLAAKWIAYGTKMQDGQTSLSSDADHAVPCRICRVSNGSCTVPPDVAPPNLRGCMLGRAAMDHPSMFWDVDRFFYKEPSNPCQNRREVLERYIRYLDRTYPRRCCDCDERVTSKIPAPDVIREREFCTVCQDVNGKDSGMSHNENDSPSHQPVAKVIKITSRVIDRSLKPVLGLFFNLKGSKAFRRACDDLSRDLRVRNCGPAYVLRKAMAAVPSYILDQDFVKTEDLGEVPTHVAPSRGSGHCCS